MNNFIYKIFKMNNYIYKFKSGAFVSKTQSIYSHLMYLIENQRYMLYFRVYDKKTRKYIASVSNKDFKRHIKSMLRQIKSLR